MSKKKKPVGKSVLQLFADWMAGHGGMMFKVDSSDRAFVIEVMEMKKAPKPRKPKK